MSLRTLLTFECNPLTDLVTRLTDTHTCARENVVSLGVLLYTNLPRQLCNDEQLYHHGVKVQKTKVSHTHKLSHFSQHDDSRPRYFTFAPSVASFSNAQSNR